MIRKYEVRGDRFRGAKRANCTARSRTIYSAREAFVLSIYPMSLHGTQYKNGQHPEMLKGKIIFALK